MKEERPSKKILVVDDEALVVAFVEAVLTDCHYEVVSTTKSEEVEELVKTEKPDLVILDILMPGIKGGEIFRKLTENPFMQNLPVIFLSAVISGYEEEQMKNEVGCCFTLAKPATREQILEVVEKALTKVS